MVDPAVEAVSAKIDSGLAPFDVSDAADILLRLSKVKFTAAYIRNAIGSSLILASCCRVVFAHPHATIGMLSAFAGSKIGADDWAQLDGSTMARLAGLRPHVNPHTWGNLLFNVVNGVAAEQLGVVDFLASSEAEMLSKFKLSAEATR
jgi:hypothetical protein